MNAHLTINFFKCCAFQAFGIFFPSIFCNQYSLFPITIKIKYRSSQLGDSFLCFPIGRLTRQFFRTKSLSSKLLVLTLYCSIGQPTFVLLPLLHWHPPLFFPIDQDWPLDLIHSKSFFFISKNMSTSDPNARLNGVSLILEWTIVLIAKRVLGNFSTHSNQEFFLCFGK